MSFCSENSKKCGHMGGNDRASEVYELATDKLQSIHGGVAPVVVFGIMLPTKGQIARKLIMNWFRPATAHAPGVR